MNHEDINEIKQQLEVYGLPVQQHCSSQEELLSAVSSYVNDLIEHDFATLVQLLYRLDISEQHLKSCFSNAQTELASNIIAKLIIDRQHQKLIAKRSFTTSTNIPEEDRW